MSSYRQMQSDTEAARALGWASIGIGLAEIAAPKQVQTLLGLEDRPEHRGVLRVLGVRELMHGVGILTERKPSHQLTTGLWGRVAGDALDTALLGVAAKQTRHPARLAAVAATVLGIGVLDAVYAARVTGHHRQSTALSWPRRRVEQLSRAFGNGHRRPAALNGIFAPSWK